MPYFLDFRGTLTQRGTLGAQNNRPPALPWHLRRFGAVSLNAAPAAPFSLATTTAQRAKPPAAALTVWRWDRVQEWKETLGGPRWLG